MHLILFVTHLLCFIIPHSITSHHERYPSPYIISSLDAIVYNSYSTTLKTTPYFSIFSISQLNKTHCLVVSLSSFLLSNGLKIQFLLFSIEFLLFSPIGYLSLSTTRYKKPQITRRQEDGKSIPVQVILTKLQ